MTTRKGRGKRKLTEFELGANYSVTWDYKKYYVCKLIKVTAKGYNLLILQEDRCLLPNHLYKAKNNSDKLKFWVHAYMHSTPLKT